MLDIRKLSGIADYFVVCSADSDRQIHAICDEIDQAVTSKGVKLHHREGSEDSGWILLDFGDVIVHVFAKPERDYYDIEKLWGAAVPVVRIL